MLKLILTLLVGLSSAVQGSGEKEAECEQFCNPYFKVYKIIKVDSWATSITLICKCGQDQSKMQEKEEKILSLLAMKSVRNQCGISLDHKCAGFCNKFGFHDNSCFNHSTTSSSYCSCAQDFQGQETLQLKWSKLPIFQEKCDDPCVLCEDTCSNWSYYSCSYNKDPVQTIGCDCSSSRIIKNLTKPKFFRRNSRHGHSFMNNQTNGTVSHSDNQKKCTNVEMDEKCERLCKLCDYEAYWCDDQGSNNDGWVQCICYEP